MVCLWMCCGLGLATTCDSSSEPLNTQAFSRTVSSAGGCTCAVLTSGDVFCDGDNNGGRCVSQIDAFPSHAIQVDVGHQFACALLLVGDIECWGTFSASFPTLGDEELYVKVSSGNGHACAITSIGQLFCVGDGTYGRTSVPNGVGVWGDVACGYHHTVASTATGELYAFGANGHG